MSGNEITHCVVKLVLSLWFCFLLLSCSSEKNPFRKTDDIKNRETQLTKLLETPEAIDFLDVQNFLLNDSCVQCHNPKQKFAGVDLTSYKAIAEKSPEMLLVPKFPEESNLYNSLVIGEGPLQMPPMPNKRITDEQRQLVYQWIKKGAAFTEKTQADSSLPLAEQVASYFANPETIDYSVVKKYVFDAGKCSRCHSQNGDSPDQRAIEFGADMNSYQSLFLLGGIVKGRPSDQKVDDEPGGGKLLVGSKIFKSVAVSNTMPPVEEGFMPLSALRVELLRLWILNCAIEEYSDKEVDASMTLNSTDGKRRPCF